MATRKHRSQEQWQSIIQQQQDSGLNAAEFCRQQGLSSKTFYKRRQAHSATSGIDTLHAPFIKMTKSSAQPVSNASAPVGVLHYHHSQLHIGAGADVHWIAQLLQALI